uniref:hypothetical protein n=1 Tax=Aeromonas sp. QDB05 TaxID=2990478 RepID=UPI0022E00DF6
LATNQIAQTGLSSLPPVIYYSEQLFSFGGKNKSLAGIPISVMFDGTGESVETDIDATKRLFRVARGQSKRFISFFSCKAGDTIYIHQDAPGYYRVSMRKPS